MEHVGNQKRDRRWIGIRGSLVGPEPLEQRALLAVQLAPDGWIGGTVSSTSPTRAGYSILTDDTGSRAYVASTDSNRVSVYSLTGVWSAETSTLDTETGINLANGNNSPTALRHLKRPHSAALGPSGGTSRHLYVAAQNDVGTGQDAAIVTFVVDSTTGALTAKDGAWTLSDGEDEIGPFGGETEVDGIKGAAEIRLTPDGLYAYVTGRNSDAVAVFRRDVATGDDFGRLRNTTPGGATLPVFSTKNFGQSQGGNFLDGTRGLAISPDGKNLYVTGRDANTLVVFERDPASTTPWLLTKKQVLQWSGGASDDMGNPNSGNVVAADLTLARFKTPTNVVISPDGKNVYVTAVSLGAENDASVSVFRRETQAGPNFGKLNPGVGEAVPTQQFYDGMPLAGGGTLEGLGGAINLAIAPDGARLYVAAHTDGVGVAPLATVTDLGGVVAFQRDSVSGALTYLGVTRGNGVTAISPNGTNATLRGTGTPGVPAAWTLQGATSGGTGLAAGDLIQITSGAQQGTVHRVESISTQTTPATATLRTTSTTTFTETGVSWTRVRSETRGALGIAVSPDSHRVFTANYGRPASLIMTGFEGSLSSFVVDVAGPPRATGVTLVKNGGVNNYFEYLVPTSSSTGSQLKTIPAGALTQVKVQFSEGVATGSLLAANLNIEDAVLGNVVRTSTGPASWDATNRWATWTLNLPLPKGQFYVVVKGTGANPVADRFGNALDGEWTNPASTTAAGGSTYSPGSGNGTPGGDLRFAITVLPGDANQDNQVGSADYTLWAAQFGLTGPGLTADFDGNGSVGSGDYSLWAANFGTDYRVWPTGGGLLMAGGGGAGSGSGASAARAAVFELYYAGVLDWQTDAARVLGWGKEELSQELGLKDFLVALEAWFEELDEDE